MKNTYVKRIFDLLLAAVVLVISLPAMVVISALIIMDSPGPVLHCSLRAGQNQKPFTMLKFRTMYTSAPLVASNDLEGATAHITSIGKWLRRTSLDELPQLFSVIVGHMSIIGPRPVLVMESSLISNREKLGVYQLKPGITGWAQVHGRDKLTNKQKALMDAEYLENRSLKMDIQILWKTLIYVIKREDIQH